ncbi:hypothetical protein Goshw_004339, partial [Gossypium schwendimanii]|nr:hypothetical protein [Gossypium schwendimanii]
MKYLLHLLLVCRWWQEDLSMFTILMIGHLESFFVPGNVLSTGLAGIQPVQLRGIENVSSEFLLVPFQFG